jgi:hypothetical protein
MAGHRTRPTQTCQSPPQLYFAALGFGDTGVLRMRVISCSLERQTVLQQRLA